MNLTLLGTGSPIPTLQRAGTALAVEIDGEPVLVDCGPKAVYGLIKNGIDPSRIEHLFFTHQHVDHNADFFHFAIASWTLGRESLRVYGPSGTDALLEALDAIYAADIEYRQQLGYDAAGITDITVETTTPGFETSVGNCRVTALPVEHSIETYAYRFDAADGSSLVFSGDTGKIPEMTEFARDADVLVHDAGIGPVTDDPVTDGLVWTDYTEPLDDWKRERLEAVHANAEQCGGLAREASVETLVLTHLLPYRATDAMQAAARAVFDGEVVVARDGLSMVV